MGLFDHIKAGIREGSRSVENVGKYYCPKCGRKTKHRYYPFSSSAKSTCLVCGYKH